MGEVVDMNQPKQGEQSFIACPCGSELGFFPVVIHDTEGPFIATLVCAGCESEIPVNHGRLVAGIDD